MTAQRCSSPMKVPSCAASSSMSSPKASTRPSDSPSIPPLTPCAQPSLATALQLHHRQPQQRPRRLRHLHRRWWALRQPQRLRTCRALRMRTTPSRCVPHLCRLHLRLRCVQTQEMRRLLCRELPARHRAAGCHASCQAHTVRLSSCLLGCLFHGYALQVEALQRLAVLLQQLAATHAAANDGSAPPPPPSDAASAVSSAAAILTWSATEAAKLPAEQQRVLLQLPVDVAVRLTSRAAARALRLLVNERDLPPMPTS